MVMCSDPAMRAPRSGWAAANSPRMAMSPGISVSAIRISLRPQSARLRSFTRESLVTFIAAFMIDSFAAASSGARRCELGGKNVRFVDTFPGELLFLAAEMTVGGRLLINRPRKVKHLAQPVGGQVEMSAHDLRELCVRQFARAKRLNHDGGRLRDPDRVGDLHLAALRQARGHDVLGDVARSVGCGTINLGRILARERAPAVAGEAAVGIHDDLASRESAIADRSADHETPGGIDVILRTL